MELVQGDGVSLRVRFHRAQPCLAVTRYIYCVCRDSMDIHVRIAILCV